MKLRKLAGLITILLSLAGANAAMAYTDVNFAFSFNDVMSPYGTWISVSSCGHCWRPYSSGYIPYTDGYWANTSYGPTWVGQEPWSWAAHHYGQWVYTAQFGWVWMPGYEWNPGRVVWATGADYIGWAPYGAGTVGSNFWVVVNRDNFNRDNYRNYAVRRDNVRGLFDRRVLTVRSGALQRAEVERITQRPMRVVALETRQVTADRRSARLVIPKDREQVVFKQLSDASRKSKEREKVTIKETSSNKSKVTVNSKPNNSGPSKTSISVKEKPKSSGPSKTVSVIEKSKSSGPSKPSVSVNEKSKSTGKEIEKSDNSKKSSVSDNKKSSTQKSKSKKTTKKKPPHK